MNLWGTNHDENCSSCIGTFCSSFVQLRIQTKNSLILIMIFLSRGPENGVYFAHLIRQAFIVSPFCEMRFEAVKDIYSQGTVHEWWLTGPRNGGECWLILFAKLQTWVSDTRIELLTEMGKVEGRNCPGELWRVWLGICTSNLQSECALHVEFLHFTLLSCLPFTWIVFRDI